MAVSKFDKRVHSILTRRGVLDNARADEVLEQAASNGKGFVERLLEGRFVEEGMLIACVSQEMGAPPIDLSKIEVSPNILEYLPEDLAKYYCALPLAEIDSLLTVAVADPFDIIKLDDLKIVTGCELRPVVSTEQSIRKAIERIYNHQEKAMSALLETQGEEMDVSLAEKETDEEIDVNDLTGEKDSPVIKLVNLIVSQAIREGASDIHIEPFEKGVQVRYRQDGSLRVALTPPRKMLNAIVSRIKVMAEMDIAERRKPQDGKFQMKVEGRKVDFRVSILPVVYGEKVVMRILDSSNLMLSLDHLGFETKALEDFRWAISQPYGMMLVTGPTGSGKSTTLYSAVREVMSETENIVTVEDPVEYQLEGVNQVPVSVKRGLTFAAALRSILRQDPDIIMIGEIRDRDTIDIAVKAALTGHLVFSTLHTNDAPSTITRMVDMGVDPFLVSSATLLVSAQRLLKRLCKECKEPFSPPAERLVELGMTETDLEGAQFFKAKGCPRCKLGYKGRFAILETLPVNDDIRRLIIQGRSSLEIKEAALANGMITLRRCALRNAARGNTSVEEVLSATLADEGEGGEKPAKPAVSVQGADLGNGKAPEPDEKAPAAEAPSVPSEPAPRPKADGAEVKQEGKDIVIRISRD